MIVHKKCDIFESGADILCHQVNCQGVMGSGVAKQVKERFPIVYSEYMNWCESRSPEDLLGCTQFIKLKSPWEARNENDFSGVFNIYGQLNYGYDGKCYTDYDALEKCFATINFFCREFFPISSPVLAFPYKFGCARGGGDWEKVFGLMEKHFTDAVVLVCECDKG